MSKYNEYIFVYEKCIFYWYRELKVSTEFQYLSRWKIYFQYNLFDSTYPRIYHGRGNDNPSAHCNIHDLAVVFEWT